MTSATGSKTRGFTLVEVLVSVTILSVGSVAVMQALGQTAAALSAAEHRRQAVVLSSSKIAEAILTLRAGQELEEHSGGTVRSGDQSMVWSLNVVSEKERPRVKTLSFTVEWKDGGRLRQSTLETILRRTRRANEPADEETP